jgi:two-component system, cell cycle response regulator
VGVWRGRQDVRRAWFGYLVAGLSIIGSYYLLPADGIGRAGRVVVYCLVSGSAAAAVAVGIRAFRPRPALPWILLGLGQLVYAAADSTFYVVQYFTPTPAYPGPADVLYLAHYPLTVAGLVLLFRARAPRRYLPGLIDAGMAGVAATLLCWLYLIAPQARAATPLLTRSVSTAYPVLDLAVLVVGLLLVLGAGGRSTAFCLLSVSLLAIFAADTVYSLQQLSGTYHAGNVLDAIWLAGNLTLGAAALHPAMAGISTRVTCAEVMLSPSRIAVLSVAALGAPVTLLVQYAIDGVRDLPVTAAACVLLFGLTIARMTGLVADQRRLAMTDPLTGLYTRRFVEEQLALETARVRRGRGSLALFIVDADHFKSINDRYGHPTGDRVLAGIAGRLRDAAREGDVLARYGGEEFALLAPNADEADLAPIAERLRAAVARAPVAAGAAGSTSVTVSVGGAACPTHAADPAGLVQVADQALYAAKARGRNRAVIGPATEPVNGTPTGLRTARMLVVDDPAVPAGTPMINYLCQVADHVDARLSPQEHSMAIARWARELSVELGQDEAATTRVELAGRLHDIGKIAVPDEILSKPARLTEAEWALMKAHPSHGARLAALVPGLAPVAEVIRQHHERFDGTGYPDRLAGPAIRSEARILAVCDSWAAMRSDRHYQAAYDEDRARAELRRGRGTQFDPELVDLFLLLHEQGRLGELWPLPDGGPLPHPAASALQNISS